MVAPSNLPVISQLAALIRGESGALLRQWREQVRELPSARHLDVPTLNDHIPQLLEELATALHVKSEETIAEALVQGTSPTHGSQRFQDGFDIGEVVAEYNILRGCVHDLADAHGLVLQGRPFHILNQVLDGAIGLAVETFAAQSALQVQRRREDHLAFVAHDLRTPLNAISLTASVLEFSLHPEDQGGETARMFKTLRRNVQHLESLVNKVLEEGVDLGTEGGVKLERRTLDLWPLVEALVHDLKPVAGTAGTQVINDVPEELVVFADAGLLRRIFQNLIANAIGYTPHGVILIGAKSGPKATVECWVSDNGAGISPEVLPTIFEKGTSDPEKEEGHGFGLAIVKTFVEAHGGMVSAESIDQRGSTIRFTLPSMAGSAASR
ncbi:MAG: HAMP domain-containing sensor histidine kinase [Flavobacteriales bacterium]